MAVAHVVSNFGWCDNGGSTHHGGLFTTSLTGTPTSASFSYTPSSTGNGILILAVSASATQTTVSMAASGWTITQIASLGIIGTPGQNAVFYAYAPNTSAATITVTWGAGCSFMAVEIDEFSGMDGTNFVDASNSATSGASSANITVNLTPVSANTMIWQACDANYLGAGGTIGGNASNAGATDTKGNGTRYLLLSGQAGVSQACIMTQSAASYATAAVAMKPPSAGRLFLPSLLSGLGAGGPFFRNPLG